MNTRTPTIVELQHAIMLGLSNASRPDPEEAVKELIAVRSLIALKELRTILNLAHAQGRDVYAEARQWASCMPVRWDVAEMLAPIILNAPPGMIEEIAVVNIDFP